MYCSLSLPCRLSVSNDLKYDAIRLNICMVNHTATCDLYHYFYRDLRDIGAKKIAVHSLNKVFVSAPYCCYLIVLLTFHYHCSFIMVRSAGREMAVSRRGSSLPPTHP